ncbi:MAG TPA: ribosome biogenesis GTP-binding protein YihA/YsxC [Thermoanaerobaculia bacterium]|nr:ribosome biogenesis GTP-binding protein YihA/YsxC [Thermoanaerobaculia bacterium]
MKIASAEFVRSAVAAGGFLSDGRPQVAFAGRSNVGKSSLLNRLLGRKALARISSTPGRTRAVNYFLVNERVWFVDLPGYGYAKAGREERRRWAELVEAYLDRSAAVAQVVLLVDAKVGATPLDVQAYDYLAGFGVPLLVAATKADKLGRGRGQQAVAEVRRALGIAAGPGATPVVPVSSKTGDGIRELWRAIDERLTSRPGDPAP